MTIYCSKIIIGILDYLQKYYKITWLEGFFFYNLIYSFTRILAPILWLNSFN